MHSNQRRDTPVFFDLKSIETKTVFLFQLVVHIQTKSNIAYGTKFKNINN